MPRFATQEGQLHVQSNHLKRVGLRLDRLVFCGAAAGLFGVWHSTGERSPEINRASGYDGGPAWIMQYVSLADQWRNAMALGHSESREAITEM